MSDFMLGMSALPNSNTFILFRFGLELMEEEMTLWSLMPAMTLQ